MNKINIFWFRRDLRINDNCGLYNILSDKNNVLPIFIFDKNILDKLPDLDKRVKFIHNELKEIKTKLEKVGSSLLVIYGKPEDIWKDLINKYDIDSVYTNHDYEPYAKSRDNDIKEILLKRNIEFKTFKDQVIFEKKEILKKDNSVYTVYTPYKNNWREKYSQIGDINYPSEKKLKNLYNCKPFDMMSLESLGFKDIKIKYPDKKINTESLKDYHKYRNLPALDSTTRISMHLRFGTVSIRDCVKLAAKFNETWLNELIWREFFMMILDNYPEVVTHSFKKEYDNIKWLNNKEDFKKWCDGTTGYPIVDAGMRELNETGYMHNRVRLIVASFLTKDLLIDWRWGERYFAEKLLDYELSSNNGNWQWCAGTGCDAAPYFRVFNPQLQTEKFDPEYKYIKKWVPEFDTPKYIKPMIEHSFARERALEAYKSALQK